MRQQVENGGSNYPPEEDAQMKRAKRTIRAGDVVKIKPEYQDPGEESIVWKAVEDEDGGRVLIEAQIDLSIRPRQVVRTEMLDIS